MTFIRSVVQYRKMEIYCSICRRVFSTRFNLNKHLKSVHKSDGLTAISYDRSECKYKCLENNCNISYKQNDHLVDHLQKIHGLIVIWETIKFKDLEGIEKTQGLFCCYFQCFSILSMEAGNRKKGIGEVRQATREKKIEYRS